jgi:YHS domain-containing protein
MKQISVLLLALGLALAASAQTKTLVNVDSSGVAIQGYDPVAFFTDHHPVKGTAEFSSQFHGATYQFASKEHKGLFDKDPAKYEPVFGGYCAYGVSCDHLAPVDVNAFLIVDGKLVMQNSKTVRDEFMKDQKGNLAKANLTWTNLVEEKGK